MVDTFGARLQERIRALGPLCVGIDPTRQLLESWDRPDSVEGLEFCSLTVLEAVLDTAAAIKPQVAFFERFGAGGYRVLERLLVEARDADIMIVADAKRGDIALTNEGYAEAWLHDRSPLVADALTVSPYVGFAALAPIFDAASASGRGVFVLAATSNDDGRTVQLARTQDDELGATRDQPLFNLSSLGGPFLVPGVGSQGASAENVARLFERCPPGTVLASVSRSVLQAGPDRAGLRDAAQRWRDDLSAALL
jgi:orotidine-5'-phosphate decarboxylase